MHADIANRNADEREAEKTKEKKKDARNLYLLQEGIIINSHPDYVRSVKMSHDPTCLVFFSHGPLQKLLTQKIEHRRGNFRRIRNGAVF